ncbi:MAG: hypothetical protein RR145_02880, partial [Oscillospiraceae bacterium]
DLTFGVNDVRNISKCLKDADILINATPLGMEGFPKDYEDLGFFEFLKKGALVSDLIYNPEKTTFLSHAENRGFIISNGMRMLINQAEIADKIWNS